MLIPLLLQGLLWSLSLDRLQLHWSRRLHIQEKSYRGKCAALLRLPLSLSEQLGANGLRGDSFVRCLGYHLLLCVLTALGCKRLAKATALRQTAKINSARIAVRVGTANDEGVTHTALGLSVLVQELVNIRTLGLAPVVLLPNT